eukprot:TRINITY_DN65564_c0_g1_i1.p1 TRINITY_DN65564_c0_g1~~TRINITY_DN65564_c0_g1_i1.p1  ORF type:complete len:221 (+),score=22.20 TRINITY_DN65564_c0_g1_i1:191-853(+)
MRPDSFLLALTCPDPQACAMVLAEGETLPAEGGLLVVLWLEVIIYLGIGIVEFFTIDFHEPPKFARNAFEAFMNSMNKKFHASICLMLGVCALQGIVSSAVSRFELEMMFFTLGLLMNMVWTTLAMPIGIRGYGIAIGLKPELWFQVWLWATNLHTVRPLVLVVSALLNIHGLAIALFVLKPRLGDGPSFTKLVEESDPDMKAKFEKMGLMTALTAAGDD